MQPLRSAQASRYVLKHCQGDFSRAALNHLSQGSSCLMNQLSSSPVVSALCRLRSSQWPPLCTWTSRPRSGDQPSPSLRRASLPCELGNSEESHVALCEHAMCRDTPRQEEEHSRGLGEGEGQFTRLPRLTSGNAPVKCSGFLRLRGTPWKGARPCPSSWEQEDKSGPARCCTVCHAF